MSIHALREEEQYTEVSKQAKQSMRLLLRTLEVVHSAGELHWLSEELEAAAWRKLQEEREPKTPYVSHPRATNPPKFES